MTLSFDLRDKPWVPVETLDGARILCSTREVLHQAHTFRGLYDDSPLVLASLTRHLLAVLHRAVDGPQSIEHWGEIASAKRFDPAAIDRYLDSDLARDRMDLFHPTHPFAQTRGLVEKFGFRPIDELLIQRSFWGGARALFRHRPQEPAPRLLPDEAARALLAHHAFAPEGLVKKPGEPDSASAGPLARLGVVLLRGNTFFETLCANLLPYDPLSDKPIAATGEPDLCAWEGAPPPRDLPLAKEPKERPAGYLAVLTWQSRRVEFAVENGAIIGFANAIGKGVSEGAPIDPMGLYLNDEKRGIVPIAINPQRAFWRSADALFVSARETKARFRRPQALDTIADPVAFRILPKTVSYSLDVHGVDSPRVPFSVVRTESLVVVATTLTNPDARAAVEKALRDAERAVSSLRLAMRTYARHSISAGTRDPNAADVSNFVTSTGAEAILWSALGAEFEPFLLDLAASPTEALVKFSQSVRRLTRDTFMQCTSSCDRTGSGLKARALAERTLARELPELRRAFSAPTTSSTETHP